MRIRKPFIPFIAIAVVAVAATVFDSVNRDVDIPLVPDIRIGESELPEIAAAERLSSDDIGKELHNTFGVPGYRMVLADRVYQAPEHESMIELIQWMRYFYWSTPSMRYRPEAYDCDNYARTFVVFSDLAGMAKFDGQIAIVRIYTSQKYSWGGVPSGGQHALVAFRSDRGWFVYEPQTGQVVSADQYPNREEVWKITAD